MKPASLLRNIFFLCVMVIPVVAGGFYCRSLAATVSDDFDGAMIVVDTTQDELTPNGNCSLREAIQAAETDTAVDACQAGAGDDTIELPNGVYALSLDGLSIETNLAIRGQGVETTRIDGGLLMDGTTIFSNTSIIAVQPGATVTITGVALTNANVGPDVLGGGINNGGTLSLLASAVMSNTASEGGGIYNWGVLSMEGTTVSGNATSSHGAGIWNWNGGVLSITNSTIGHNRIDLVPTDPGNTPGACGDGGGIWNEGKLTITNSTIRHNRIVNPFPTSETSVGGGSGGGIWNKGTMAIINSTISSNAAGDGSDGVPAGSSVCTVCACQCLPMAGTAALAADFGMPVGQ